MKSYTKKELDAIIAKYHDPDSVLTQLEAGILTDVMLRLYIAKSTTPEDWAQAPAIDMPVRIPVRVLAYLKDVDAVLGTGNGRIIAGFASTIFHTGVEAAIIKAHASGILEAAFDFSQEVADFVDAIEQVDAIIKGGD